MRLMEAILDANHRAASGDSQAGLRVADYEEQLPVVALTCIDPRLNPLMPEVLGIPETQFIWLRNAGNIITSPLSSTMRSLSLACAIKGGKEIVIIGHTDCQVGKVGTMQLLERFQALGIGRLSLPDNLNEFFGTFSSERQNVIKAAGYVRQSPLISPAVPVHGLLVEIDTGKLEWLVNGYETLGTDSVSKWNKALDSASQTIESVQELSDFQIGGVKFPETKLGEAIATAGDWVQEKLKEVHIHPPKAPATSAPQPPPASPQPLLKPASGAPPKLPLPFRARLRRRT